MANQDAAFGLRPLGKIGGSPDNNAATEYEVAACASAFAQNDLMVALAAGTVGIGAATDNGVLLGSCQGVFFTDASTSKPTFANHLVASNAATDIKAFITDDPHQVYEIQSDASGATQQLDVSVSGTNASFVIQAMDISQDPGNSATDSANGNILVRINKHFYRSGTGI